MGREAGPEGRVGPEEVARAQGLLVRFLAGRGERTLQAYTGDLEEFAAYLDLDPVAAVAELLAGGRGEARRTVLEYALSLRRRGRAPATVARRLGTLRALVRSAVEAQAIEWPLEVPSEEQVDAILERQAAESAAPHVLARHRDELDRLDIQHYGLREALGANYLAPVAGPRLVLDAGTGTGQWGFEVSERFPEALVVGLDLFPGKPGGPPGYRHVRGNLLRSLPFRDDLFDFVHQRLLVAGLPLARWPGEVRDLVRVTRPGGWIELVEPPITLEGAGPATERLLALTRRVTAAAGLDPGRAVFDALDAYLRDAGVAGVSRREIKVPIGRAGGLPGRLMVTDLRIGFTWACEALQARSILGPEEGRGLVHAAQVEWEEGHMSWTFGLAFGQKP